MSRLPPMVFRYTNIGTANQKFHLLDSSRLLVEPWAASTTLPSTAGSYRGGWARAKVDWQCLVGTDDITIVRQIWSGSWVDAPTVGTVTASHTIAAGVVTTHSWVPEAPDWRIYGLLGATPPTSLYFEATVDLDVIGSGA